MFGGKICNYQTLKECNFSKQLNSDIHRNAVRFLSVDISLTEGRECDERDNFIPSVEDVNEREQNLDNDNARNRVIILTLCSTLHIYVLLFQISINSI